MIWYFFQWPNSGSIRQYHHKLKTKAYWLTRSLISDKLLTGWFRSSNGIAVSFLWTHPASTLKERKYNLITSWPRLLCLPPFNWNPTIPNLATLSGCPLYEFSSNANQFWTALCHQTVCHQHSELLLPIVVSLKVGPDFLLEGSLIFSPLLKDITPSLQKSQVFNLHLSMWIYLLTNIICNCDNSTSMSFVAVEGVVLL